MSEFFIIDAHLHIGAPGVFFAPQSEPAQLLSIMDKLNIRFAVCTDHLSLVEGAHEEISNLRKVFEESNGRIFYLGVFDPRCSDECLTALKQASAWPGFVGIKIHPTFHRTPAESSVYEQAWKFAADYDIALLTHSWSPSNYNPAQSLSVPMRFEKFIKKYPEVRFVFAHAGGRGTGRHEVIQMAGDYRNVYVDFAGDIFDYKLIENLVKSMPPEKILFGSDFPWLDARANLSRVFLSNIGDTVKKKILIVNASKVYKIGLNNAED